MYEFFEHTADVGLRAQAPSFDELLVEAARGLFATIIDHPKAVTAREHVDVRVQGSDRAYLLVDWLAELLHLFQSRGLVLGEFVVHCDESGLRAKVGGEPLDPDRHGSAHEVKAVTYHRLRVERSESGWLAEVILDL